MLDSTRKHTSKRISDLQGIIERFRRRTILAVRALPFFPAKDTLA